MECMLKLAAVPEPGCQETGRKAYGKVGWRLGLSCCPLEAFLGEPKLNSRAPRPSARCQGEAQGKRTDVGRAHLWPVGFPTC